MPHDRTCCDGLCRQGRDCPGRTEGAAAMIFAPTRPARRRPSVAQRTRARIAASLRRVARWLSPEASC